jgi:hypothetical protein
MDLDNCRSYRGTRRTIQIMKKSYYLVLGHDGSSNSSGKQYNLKEARTQAKKYIADTENYPTLKEVRICDSRQVGVVKARYTR